MTILFLDFDGVLHPHAVYRRKKGIVLEAEGHALFEHCDLLESILEPHPDIRIVLSTSWAWTLDFKRAKSRLPSALQDRVKGSTWHSSMDTTWWCDLTRFEQIQTYVERHRLDAWIAIDDNDIGWPDDQRHHLVYTDEWKGLGDAEPQAKLAEWLEDMKNKVPKIKG